MTSTRRASLITALGTPLAAQANAAAPGWEGFPRQLVTVAREIVGAAHTDLAKVKALVAAHPAAVNATIDWGFGDWESALGAAAHTGRRPIAEFLLANGARLDLFAAAMLGMTSVVKGLIAAQPGIESTLGPHGIPLLAHARAGGELAKETFDYLATLPGAGRGIPTPPLDDERRRAFVGRYAIPGGGQVEIKLSSPAQLSLVVERSSLRIHHAGNETFYPAGSPKVRIEFEQKDGRPVRLRIIDGALTLAASRTD